MTSLSRHNAVIAKGTMDPRLSNRRLLWRLCLWHQWALGISYISSFFGWAYLENPKEKWEDPGRATTPLTPNSNDITRHVQHLSRLPRSASP